jgi:hypothetical protein
VRLKKTGTEDTTFKPTRFTHHEKTTESRQNGLAYRSVPGSDFNRRPMNGGMSKTSKSSHGLADLVKLDRINLFFPSSLTLRTPK